MALTAGILKSRLKLQARKWRSWYEAAFFGFTPEDLGRVIREMGVQRGGTVFVHSAFGNFGGFSGTAVDVIRLLQELVGEEGAVLMPNQPTQGSAIDWIRSGEVWDEQKTPTRMGLLPEFFRRMPGVRRSLHPTHPVAGWGRKAESMLAGHEEAETPCGTGSPYMKLIEERGQILHLGSGFHTTTFLHAVEEFTIPHMPVSPWTGEFYEGRVRGRDGRERVVRTRLFRPDLAAVRNPGNLVDELQRRGHYQRRMLKRLELIVVDAAGLAATARELAPRGIFHYDFGKLSPASQFSTVPPQE